MSNKVKQWRKLPGCLILVVGMLLTLMEGQNLLAAQKTVQFSVPGCG